jgi:hypothetical protein
VKSGKTIRVSLGSLLIGFAAAVVAITKGSPEPSFKGLPLSRWLKDYEDANSPGTKAYLNRTEVFAASDAAVKAIGTNAFPTLLAWVQTKTSPVRDAVGGLLLRDRYLNAEDKRRMSWWGFHLLKDESRGVASNLAELSAHSDRDVRECAVLCLMDMVPSKEVFLPVLVKRLHDTSPGNRKQAALYIIMHYPEDAEDAGVFHVFPDLRTATIYETKQLFPQRLTIDQ